MIKRRSRLCHAPTLAALTISHSEAYPHSARLQSTSDSPREVSAGTFSATTILGKAKPMSRCISHQRPERSPANPAPFPAMLISWQGNPPQMTSAPLISSALTVLTSSNLFESGQCFASTWRQKSSCSTCQQVRSPGTAASRPSSRPPIPLNNEHILSSFCISFVVSLFFN